MDIRILDGWNKLLTKEFNEASEYMWLYKTIKKINDTKIDSMKDSTKYEADMKKYEQKITDYNNLITKLNNYTNYDKNKFNIEDMRKKYNDKITKYNTKIKECDVKIKEINDYNDNIINNKNKLNNMKDNFEKLHNRAKEYFEGSPYYMKNKAKCYLYELLNYVIQLVIGNNIKSYLMKILYHNVSKEKESEIMNIFTSFKIFNNNSLTEHIMTQSVDMIKSSIGLFADEVEEENYERKTITSIIETTIDTFIEQRNSSDINIFTIDSSIVKILKESKSILSEYFESFVGKYINNLVSVYENNMRFVINHYRLYNMYIKSLE